MTCLSSLCSECDRKIHDLRIHRTHQRELIGHLLISVCQKHPCKKRISWCKKCQETVCSECDNVDASIEFDDEARLSRFLEASEVSNLEIMQSIQ